MYDGVLRGAALLRQRAARPRDERPPAAPRAGGGARRGGALWLAVVACGVGVLIAFGPAGRPGAEVVVAAVLVAAAALLLARPGRRLGEV